MGEQDVADQQGAFCVSRARTLELRAFARGSFFVCGLVAVEAGLSDLVVGSKVWSGELAVGRGALRSSWEAAAGAWKSCVRLGGRVNRPFEALHAKRPAGSAKVASKGRWTSTGRDLRLSGVALRNPL